MKIVCIILAVLVVLLLIINHALCAIIEELQEDAALGGDCLDWQDPEAVESLRKEGDPE